MSPPSPPGFTPMCLTSHNNYKFVNKNIFKYPTLNLHYIKVVVVFHHECFSLHLAVFGNRISKTIEANVKLHV